jgi:hypothetical protein
VGKDAVVWITARDGSVHATQPPIIADGQAMLCGRAYARRDLRIRVQGTVGHAPAGACPECRDRVAREPSEGDVTRILNAFQRDARAAFEELLPFLHRPGLYPDATVDGWGDSRGGRGIASTVVLLSPKGLRPPEQKTKELGKLRLEVGATGEWSATVSVVGLDDERAAWPPPAEAAWWDALQEKLRAQIVEHRETRAAPAAPTA